MTTPILVRDHSDQVQKKLGYERWEWKDFQRFTKEEGESLLRAKPDYSWSQTDHAEREAIRDRISKRMATPIREDALDWRMPKVVSTLKDKVRRELDAEALAMSLKAGNKATSSDSTPQGEAGEAEQPSAVRERFFDPVREV